MPTSSFDKTFTVNDDKAADVLIQLARENTPRPAPRTPQYRLVSNEELVKKVIKR